MKHQIQKTARRWLALFLCLCMAIPSTMTLASAAEGDAGEGQNFTVQYYANLDVAKKGNGGDLTVIDTSGKALPKNGTTPNTTKLFLTEATDANNGKYAIATTSQLTEVYQEHAYDFASHNDLASINRLEKNDNYALSQIWVLTGTDAASTNPEDWTVYPRENGNLADIQFTNNKENNDANTILIQKDTVLRLVYDTTKADYSNNVFFYDYDITEDGQKTWDSTNGPYGINSNENYSDTGAKFAFGNANTGTGLHNESWNGNTLNQYNGIKNSDERGYLGCTFGLVTGLENGKLQFAKDVTAPSLFHDPEANVTGKTAYEYQEDSTNTQYKLAFNRVGDTYTLSSVEKPGAEESVLVLNDLEYFNHPQTGETVHDHIWTNNFWPMDSTPGKDGLTGKNENRGSYSGYDGDKTYPPSDDGLEHNNMFGMQYSVGFSLTKDYCGPLEYYFFGDDDMWVFLTNPDGNSTLVCDIGGVHSSVGEYVNLWDYIQKGSEGNYTLSFFYTERGLSGSTCYMQFTLPSVSSVIPGQETGSLAVTKNVEGADTDETFSFTLSLTDGDGTPLSNTYASTIESADGTSVPGRSVTNGGTFALADGQTITIHNLPVGTQYTVTETATDNYVVSYTNPTGSIEKDATATVTVTNSAPGSLTVEKLVEGDGILPDGGFPFTVTLTDENNAPVTGSFDVVYSTTDTTEPETPEEETPGEDVPEEETPGEDVSEPETPNEDASDETVSGEDAPEAAATKEGENAPTEGEDSETPNEPEGGDGDAASLTFDENGQADFFLQSAQSITITGIPDGTNYFVEETDSSGYQAIYSGSDATGTILAGETATVTVTNSMAPITLPVTKVWNDADNKDGLRPDSVTVTLLANGETTDKTLTLNAENNWSATFTGLAQYQDGQEITYTVQEATVDGYTVQVTGDAVEGFTITNTHTPEDVTVSGSKTWDDGDNQDGKRPDSITVRLLANGVENGSATVTAENAWAWSFEDLPKYADGKEIVYTVTEDTVADYTTTVNGYDITNTYTPGQTSLTVTKAWQDGNNQDGLRPDSVTVTLLANGETTDKTLTLNAENNWSGTFTGLAQYQDGQKITYTVQEATVDGYTVQVTGDAVEGFVITNSHTPALVDLSGSKTWDDSNDREGMRPDAITVRLYADGQQVKTATVTAADGWAWTFEDLPKYDDGQEIAYTITEDTVSGYQSEINGMQIINHYTPGQINIPVTKSWQDRDDADGIRPDSITVKLYADGKDTGKALVLTQNDDWTGSFDDLDVYAADGGTILYTIAEVAVEGYDASVSGSASTGFVVSNSHTPDQPNDPDKPDDPDQPGKPDNPDDPDNPDPSQPGKPDPGRPGKPDDVPQTGDPTDLALWLTLLAVSGAGIATTLILSKKKHDREDPLK